MARTRVELIPAGWEELLVVAEERGLVEHVGPAIIRDAYRNLIAASPALARRLAPKLAVKRTGKRTISVGIWDDPVAVWAEDGTAPHEIRAKGGALRFGQNGAWAFYKRVMHPGTKAHHYLRSAATKIRTSR